MNSPILDDTHETRWWNGWTTWIWLSRWCAPSGVQKGEGQQQNIYSIMAEQFIYLRLNYDCLGTPRWWNGWTTWRWLSRRCAPARSTPPPSSSERRTTFSPSARIWSARRQKGYFILAKFNYNVLIYTNKNR